MVLIGKLRGLFLKSHEARKPVEELELELAEYVSILNSYWRHRKGGAYQIKHIAYRESTMALEVVYASVSEDVVYIRPLAEFMDGRFTRVSDLGESGILAG